MYNNWLSRVQCNSAVRRSGWQQGQPKDADVAQLVEQRIRNAKVGGSTPLIGTNIHAALRVFSTAAFSLCGLRETFSVGSPQTE